jgi:hypothetical protein
LVANPFAFLSGRAFASRAALAIERHPDIAVRFFLPFPFRIAPSRGQL